MAKIREYDKEHRDGVRQDVENSGEMLGLDSYEANKGTNVSDAVDIYGVCKGCRYFRYIRYEFHGQLASCNMFEVRLSGKQRIMECNSYDERGKLTLNQMMEMAWIIDVSARTVGFTDN